MTRFALIIAALWATASVAATIQVPLQRGSDPAANSAALQSAIDHAAPGDIVAIPAGTFPISDSILLRSRINLAGAGTTATALVPVFNQEQPIIVGSGVGNVESYGFTLDGQGNTKVTQGIQLEKSSSLNLHDLAILNIPGSPDPNAPLGPHAIDCTIGVTQSIFNAITARSIGVGREWGGGIRLSWNSTANRVTFCDIDQTGRGGIFCNDGSTDNIITDNIVSHSGGVGLGIEVQNCDRSLIERNKIDHWLSVDNSSLSSIRNNTVNATDNTYKLCGIEIVDSHDVIVSSNAVTGGAQVGLSISGPKPKERILFANNLFSKSSTWGAQIQGDAGGVRELYFNRNAFLGTVQGPDPLYPNQGHGFRINGDAHFLTFNRNEIAHNLGVGLQITGDDVDDLSFYKNVITDNKGDPVDSDPIKHLNWLGNQIVPIPSKWLQNAQATPAPTISLDIQGATPAAPGSDHFEAVAKATLHLTVQAEGPFIPKNALWDIGWGVPRTTMTTDQSFDTPGSYPISVVTWDATGQAAGVSVTIDVKPPSPGRGN